MRLGFYMMLRARPVTLERDIHMDVVQELAGRSYSIHEVAGPKARRTLVKTTLFTYLNKSF